MTGSHWFRAALRWSPWVIGSALVCVLFWTDFSHVSHGSIDHKVFWGRDFVNLWAGGRLIRSGGLSEIYDLAAYRHYLGTLFGPLKLHNYSYPPVSFPLALMFGLMPYWLALTAWLGGTAILFARAVRPWWPNEGGAYWLAVLAPAGTIDLWAGQNGFLLGTLFVLGWRFVDERPRLAGLFFGLMILKPHLALLSGVALLVRRDWRVVAAGIVTAGLLTLISGLWFGWAAWADYLSTTSRVQAAMIDARGNFFALMSTSSATAILEVGGGWTAALLIQTAAALLAISLVVIAAWRGAPTRELALLTAPATFLLLPYAFNYDMVVVTVTAWRLMCRRDIPRHYRWAATAGFLSPQLGMVLAAIDLPLMPLMIAALAAVQFRLCLAAAPGADRADPFKQHTATAA